MLGSHRSYLLFVRVRTELCHGRAPGDTRCLIPSGEGRLMQESSCKVSGRALGKDRESAWVWLSCTTAQSVVGTAWAAGKDGSRIPRSRDHTCAGSADEQGEGDPEGDVCAPGLSWLSASVDFRVWVPWLRLSCTLCMHFLLMALQLG